MLKSENQRRKREKFLIEEDEKLKELVLKYGENNWIQISKEIKTRNVRQVRERWKHYLSNNKDKREWTNEEDILLLNKFIELGPKWTKISKFFKDRTDIQIKTRYFKINKLNNVKTQIEKKNNIEFFDYFTINDDLYEFDNNSREDFTDML